MPAAAGVAVVCIDLWADARRDPGSLIAEAIHLVPEGELLFAAVSPGNARSLRAFLSLGFTPIGSECLIRPEPA